MLSVGPYSYNRFEAYEKRLTEGAKPDFLDKDKDGDKKESFKKAVSDSKKDCDCKGKEDCDCDKKESKKDKKLPPWLQKEGNCYQEGGKVKGKKTKEVKEALINSLMGDGLANNPVSAEIIAEHMSDEWVEAILSELN